MLPLLVKILIITCYFVTQFALPSVTFAQIKINEVHPYPSAGLDWIEIINFSPEPVDLNGWFIKDVLSSSTTIHTFSDTLLQPLELLVIEVSNKLNNSGDGVTLYDRDQTPIDSMDFSQSVSAMSWARELDGIGNFISTAPSRAEYNNQEVLPVFPPQPSPSPSSPGPSSSPTTSPVPSPTVPPSNYDFLLLSEVVACPAEGNQEWVELFNNSPERIELKDWVIKDSHSNKRIFDLTIDPWSYGVVAWSGALLNNAGDQVVLTTPQNTELERLDLPGCTPNTSYARFNGLWEPTDHITPGLANIKAEEDSPSPSPSALVATNEESSSPLATASATTSADNYPPEPPTIPIPYPGILPELTHLGKVLGITSEDIAKPTFLDTSPSTSPNFSALSAIIGGLCMCMVSSYSLYETLNKTASSVD